MEFINIHVQIYPPRLKMISSKQKSGNMYISWSMKKQNIFYCIRSNLFPSMKDNMQLMMGPFTFQRLRFKMECMSISMWKRKLEDCQYMNQSTEFINRGKNIRTINMVKKKNDAATLQLWSIKKETSKLSTSTNRFALMFWVMY